MKLSEKQTNHYIILEGIKLLNEKEIYFSKKKFFTYYNAISQMSQMMENQLKFQIKGYVKSVFSHDQIINLYSGDNHMHTLVNLTLRGAQKIEDFFIIGEPYLRLTQAVKYFNKKSQKENLQKNVCYRSSYLSNEQFQYLKSNFGLFIQNLGFLSTSKHKANAKKFSKQWNKGQKKPLRILKFTFSQALVLNQFENLDQGYVEMNKFNLSKYPYEEQILFNPMNIFRMKAFDKYEQEGEIIEEIELQYNAFYDLIAKRKRDGKKSLKQDQKKIYQVLKFISKVKRQIKSFDEALKTLQIYNPQLKKKQLSFGFQKFIEGQKKNKRKEEN